MVCADATCVTSIVCVPDSAPVEVVATTEGDDDDAACTLNCVGSASSLAAFFNVVMSLENAASVDDALDIVVACVSSPVSGDDSMATSWLMIELSLRPSPRPSDVRLILEATLVVMGAPARRVGDGRRALDFERRNRPSL